MRQGCLSVPRTPGLAGIIVTQKHKLKPGDISRYCNDGSSRNWGFWNILECSRMFDVPGGDHEPRWIFISFCNRRMWKCWSLDLWVSP